MPLVIVEAVAPVSSWRPPEAQNYQPTFPLPPYTSQVGLLGAALGLDLPSAFQFIEEHQVKLGVAGWHKGNLRDLWKFQKLESIADPKKEIKSDIVLREHWVDSRLIFLFEVSDRHVADQIANAFQKPAFPLTAGTSDALLHAQRVCVVEQTPTPAREFAHTIIFKDIAADYQVDPATLTTLPVMQSIRAPSIERIPTGFTFDASGNRKLAGRAVVTFIGDRITLSNADESIEAYEIIPTGTVFVSEMKSWPQPFLMIPVHSYASTISSAKAS